MKISNNVKSLPDLPSTTKSFLLQRGYSYKGTKESFKQFVGTRVMYVLLNLTTGKRKLFLAQQLDDLMECLQYRDAMLTGHTSSPQMPALV